MHFLINCLHFLASTIRTSHRPVTGPSDMCTRLKYPKGKRSSFSLFEKAFRFRPRRERISVHTSHRPDSTLYGKRKRTNGKASVKP
eukprot:1889258-Prymnesium_polylepis.1